MIVANARIAAELLQSRLSTAEVGSFAVLHLDGDRRLLASAALGAGDDEVADLPIRDLLAGALEAGASAVIVGRSHDRTDPAPTEEDRASARRLAEAAAAAGIGLADYFTFAGAECRSFRELGLL